MPRHKLAENKLIRLLDFLKPTVLLSYYHSQKYSYSPLLRIIFTTTTFTFYVINAMMISSNAFIGIHLALGRLSTEQ